MELIKKPSAQQVMSFSQDDVNQLPHWTNLDVVKPGMFAKETYMKAPSSLVLVVKTTEVSVCYVNCNRHNGIVSMNGYACTVLKRDLLGSHIWMHTTSVPDDFERLFEKYTCDGCDTVTMNVYEEMGHKLCKECYDNYEDKTGHCSVECCLGHGCTGTC